MNTQITYVNSVNDLPINVDKSILALILELKKEGYRIGFKHYKSLNDKQFTWCYISKNNSTMYLQLSRGCYSFSTCHVPTKGLGTGYGLGYDFENYGHKYVKFVNDNIHKIAPEWAHASDFDRIKKYDSLESVLSEGKSNTVDLYIF